MIAWGDETRLRDRIEAHHQAGATHVCVTLVRSEGSARERAMPDERALATLAPN
jgi:hypothetical protein